MGDETAELGSWSGAAGADRELGSRLRAARQQVQDGRRRLAVWKIFWSGGPRPERGWEIGYKRELQLSLRVADGRGSQYMEGEGEGSRKQSTLGRGFKIRRQY